MLYRKLKRTWSQGYSNYIPNFDEVFPELKNLSQEELCDRFRKLNLSFYQEEQKPIPVGIRFTMPFALLTILLMFILLPINFLITGSWGYSLDNKKNLLLNWFRSLKLM